MCIREKFSFKCRLVCLQISHVILYKVVKIVDAVNLEFTITWFFFLQINEAVVFIAASLSVPGTRQLQNLHRKD